VVEEFLDGSASQAQLCRRYELSPNLVREWRRKYEAGEFDVRSPAAVTQRERDLEQRVAELERKIGQLTMENEVLRKKGALPRRRNARSGLLVSGPKDSASHEDAS
jgi:transposase-like protein